MRHRHQRNCLRLLWLGHPGRLLEAAANGRITLYTSPVLVAELRSTLSYDRLAQRVERSGLTLDAAHTSSSRPTCRRSCATCDDDHLLACALAASADLIVTGDKDLLTLNTYQNTPIVTVAEALRRIEAQK